MNAAKIKHKYEELQRRGNSVYRITVSALKVHVCLINPPSMNKG